MPPEPLNATSEPIASWWTLNQTALGAGHNGGSVPKRAAISMSAIAPKCRYLGFVAGQTGDLGFCVEDMSSTECSAVEALGAEGSCELFSEGGVVGA